MPIRRFMLAAVLAAGFVGTASAQCDRRFSLSNQSGATVNEFYFGSSAQRSWGVDQLGENVLPAGRTARFETRSPGRNDFRIVWANGQTAEVMGVDICSTSEIVATRSGIEAR